MSERFWEKPLGPGTWDTSASPDRIRELRAMPYEEYLKSSEWRTKRRQKLMVSGSCCYRCGSRDRLQVHHRIYGNLGCEEWDDLEVLCADCHEQEHTR